MDALRVQDGNRFRQNDGHGMLAAWSILNKVNARADGRFSDTVLIICPNVTIRDRLAELKVDLGEASLYRKRDLVSPRLMPALAQGRVITTNWHVFEPQVPKIGSGLGYDVLNRQGCIDDLGYVPSRAFAIVERAQS